MDRVKQADYKSSFVFRFDAKPNGSIVAWLNLDEGTHLNEVPLDATTAGEVGKLLESAVALICKAEEKQRRANHH
jgi:hypothetical protein